MNNHDNYATPEQFVSIDNESFAFLLSDDQMNKEQYDTMLKSGTAIINKYLNRDNKICSGIPPQELEKLFTSIDLNIPMTDTASVLQELEKLYMEHAVYFHRPKYAAHLNCPIVTPSLLAEQIIAAINTSIDTYDQSLGGTFIEKKVIDWTNSRIGFNQNADGIFTSGGSQSNMMALLAARDHFCLERLNHYVFKKGLPAEAGKFRVFTSEVSHFSFQKNAAFIGLGQDAVIPIAVDENHRMDVVELEKAIRFSIAEGLIPLMVVATCGTTNFGSFDPIFPIAEIANEYGLWLHADAAYGCGLLISNEYAHLIEGINLADSVTVDFHKSFFQSVSCSAFLVKNKQHLNYFTYHVDYLNPVTETNEGIPNHINKSMQNTRRFDPLKVWMTLRIMGPQHLGSYFDKPIALAKEVAKYLQENPEFELINLPVLGTLVFRFLPAGISDDDLIGQINKQIREEIFRSGEAMIAGMSFRGIDYLKFTLLNPTTSLEDIIEILNLIRNYGKKWS